MATHIFVSVNAFSKAVVSKPWAVTQKWVTAGGQAGCGIDTFLYIYMYTHTHTHYTHNIPGYMLNTTFTF